MRERERKRERGEDLRYAVFLVIAPLSAHFIIIFIGETFSQTWFLKRTSEIKIKTITSSNQRLGVRSVVPVKIRVRC